MAKIVTLKNNNDEEVYPITTAEAVNGGLYADNGTEVTGVVPDVTTSRIEDGAVTSDKIDWTTLPADSEVANGLGWVYLGETYTTTASQYVDFTLPELYNNYKVYIAGQATSSCPSNSWIDTRAMNGASTISTDQIAIDGVSGAVTCGSSTGAAFIGNGALSAYDSFIFEICSFNTRSTNWQQWSSKFSRAGNQQLRIQSARANSNAKATGIRVAMGGAYIADCVIKVWGSNN